MRKVFVAALLLFALAVLPALAQAPTGVTLQKALQLAQKGNAGMTLLYARSESKGGGVWGFYFLMNNGKIWEKEITKPKGALTVNKEVESIDDPGPGVPSDAPAQVVEAVRNRVLVKLPNSRYIEIAEGQNGGLADGYQLTLVGNQLQVVITGSNDNGAWQCTLDMTTGQVLNNNSK